MQLKIMCLKLKYLNSGGTQSGGILESLLGKIAGPLIKVADPLAKMFGLH